MRCSKITPRGSSERRTSAETLNETGRTSIYGNPAGVELVKGKISTELRLGLIEKELRRLKEEDDHLQHQIEEEDGHLHDQIATLTELNYNRDRQITNQDRQITDLKAASEGFLDIRERFIDVMKRDLFHTIPYDARSTRAIRKGNEAAQHGDVMGDALLYKLRSRTDTITFLKIYGIPLEGLNYLCTSLWLIPS
jgi:hypothetical protein